MSDDAEIPFGPQPEEKLPPVTPEPKPIVKNPAQRCVSLTKAGTPCQWYRQHKNEYCYFHDPTVTKEERLARSAKGGKNRPTFANSPLLVGQGGFISKKPRTIKEILALVSYRIDNWVGRWEGSSATPETESIFCDLVRTYVAVLKCGNEDEAMATVGKFSLQRRQA